MQLRTKMQSANLATFLGLWQCNISYKLPLAVEGPTKFDLSWSLLRHGPSTRLFSSIFKIKKQFSQQKQPAQLRKYHRYLHILFGSIHRLALGAKIFCKCLLQQCLQRLFSALCGGKNQKKQCRRVSHQEKNESDDSLSHYQQKSPKRNFRNKFNKRMKRNLLKTQGK